MDSMTITSEQFLGSVKNCTGKCSFSYVIAIPMSYGVISSIFSTLAGI